jgi:hypothetical protein
VRLTLAATEGAMYEGFDIGEFAIFHATRTATLTLVKEA